MEINKISFAQFIATIKEAISYGKAHYLVLFVGATINLGVETVLNLTTLGSIIYFVFATMWLAGIAFVAQTIIAKQKAPTVSQFFVAFYKRSILKKLVPSLVGSAVLNIVLGLFLAVIIGIFTIMNRDSSPDAVVSYARLMGMGSLLFMVICIFFNVPFFFFPLVLIFQDLPWKQALKGSTKATVKNFVILAFYLAPGILTLVMGSLILFLIPSFPAGFSDSIWYKVFAQYSSSGLRVIFLFFTPYFLTLLYLLYKKMFTFAQPDADIESAS